MEILTELQMIELKLDNKKRGICKKKKKINNRQKCYCTCDCSFRKSGS